MSSNILTVADVESTAEYQKLDDASKEGPGGSWCCSSKTAGGHKDKIFLRDWMKPIQKYIKDFEKNKLGPKAPKPAPGEPDLREYKSLKELIENISGKI